MIFPLGKPLLLMLVISVVTGLTILFRPADRPADLTVWTFVDRHALSFRQSVEPGGESLTDLFQRETGQSVAVKLIGYSALNVRLNAVFDRDDPGPGVPDLVEIEIGTIGRYFRPPIGDIAFLPLNDRLQRDGLLDRLLPARMSPWTKQGVIFGVPRDVHPVSITYRRDLFDQAGIDLGSATTWPVFQDRCLAFQAYWAKQGKQIRAIEMQRAAGDAMDVLLLQQQINLLDDRNVSHFSDPRVAKTIAFYAQCVAGPKRIGGDSTPGPNGTIYDLSQGTLAAMITPDWVPNGIKTAAPALAGKLSMMPLPRFNPTDARTATRGGTMMGIPRHARDPEQSWRLLKTLYFSPEALKARQHYTAVLPPLRDAWQDPIWHTPEPFYGGQKINELYIELAAELPRRYVTPFTLMANQAVMTVAHRAVVAIENGESDLERKIAAWLVDAEKEVAVRMAFGRFDE